MTLIQIMVLFGVTVAVVMLWQWVRLLAERVENLERVSHAHLGITQSLCSETQRAVLDAALKNTPDTTVGDRRKMH